MERKFSSDLEIPKYLKWKENDISKANKKSKHKHQYEECLIRYKWNWDEHKIHTSLNSYCTICGKINDKMKNSIVIDYMQKVDTPVGKRYRQISEDILYDTYHGRLPVFFVEDICKDKYVNFIRLLEEIHLKETDTLYVLGDILDRGPHPIQIILKLMEMPNVICLTGNHELMALECLEFLMQEITEISIEKVDEKMLENLMTWQYNGSKSTIDEFRTLSREMQYEVIDFIKDFMIYEELTVNGKNYLLVHGGLGNYYPGKDIEEYSLKELIWDRAEYDIQYFEDTYVVTGHTPTQGILGNPKPGYIYKANHHIAIDCGCNRRNGRLAAVCLDTGREYYVEKS